MNQNPEIYVQRFCLEHGLILRKIAAGSQPTPDFEALHGNFRELVLEVKNFEPFDELQLDLDFTVEAAMRGCLRDDNGPGRVGKVIHAAAKQLRSYSCPKVLVVVNDEPCLDVHDLDAAYRGYLLYRTSDRRLEADRSSARIADGRVRDSKTVIDLYVWIDRSNETVSFRFRGRSGREVAERFFRYPAPPQNGSV